MRKSSIRISTEKKSQKKSNKIIQKRENCSLVLFLESYLNLYQELLSLTVNFKSLVRDINA